MAGATGAVRRSFVFRDAAWLLAEEAEIRAAYRAGDRTLLSHLIRAGLGLPETDPASGAPSLEVTHLPFREWEIDLPADREAERLVRERRAEARDAALAIRFAGPEIEAAFRAAVEPVFGRCDPQVGDVPIAHALHWAPGRAEGATFGTLAAARRLVGAGVLAAAGLDGAGVNLVVVDQGVDASRLPPGAQFMGGWMRRGTTLPGQAAKDVRHGTMVAHAALAIAPKVQVWDCPLIPPRIRSNLPAFLSDALGAIERMREDIALLKEIDPATYGGRWVFVNAWSIYDRRGEAETGDCTCTDTHAALRAVQAATEVADIVFAAGNCGAFAPDGRCTDDVIGPGRSILGPNSLPGVLTVGAVRTDGIWAGYSSQGPGQFSCGCDGAQQKPDLAAPSDFRMGGILDGSAGGTSAASAVAAGIVAALRTRGARTAAGTPDDLFDLLRATARRDPAAGWNPRTGHGVIDAAAAWTAA